ncbi:MAG: hypothetical protein R2705_21220 [Ilumatobacteraceae bacterium]
MTDVRAPDTSRLGRAMPINRRRATSTSSLGGTPPTKSSVFPPTAKLCVYTSAPTHLVVDVAGTFTAA